MAKYIRRDATAMDTWDPVLYWYARAVGEMQQRNPDEDPTGWVYQARIHGVEKSRLTKDTRPGWNQCPHGGWFFLPWHRGYLWYFEKIVRAAIQQIATREGHSAPKDWALPYWNYARDPAGELPAFTSRALPAAFREPTMPEHPDGSGQQVPNPLYLPDAAVPEKDFWKKPHRGLGKNSAAEVVPYDEASPYCAMLRNLFSLPLGPPVPQPSFGSGNTGHDMPHYEKRGPGVLELTPHGMIHDGVAGWMGEVAGSARDPIFWLHHANIDRFWPAWLRRGDGRKNPNDQSWLTRKYTFFDEAGTLLTPTTEEVLTSAGDYEYQSLDSGTGEQPAVCARQLASAEERVLVMSNPGHPLSLAGPTEVPLEAANDSSQTQDFLASGAVPENGLILTVRGIRSNVPPGTPYRIYLNPPQGQGEGQGRPDDAYFVGWVSFFGSSEGEHHGNGDGNEFSYDITERVRQLQEQGMWAEGPVTVSLIPSTTIPSELAVGPHAPQPTIDRVTITTQ
ncbi:tyrosinase family protein [Streptomyces sp. NPDC001793]|uniref:tyrosinase family protein n=1 Tax=Streptomyces sp. NPDC001793 TaxID=3154657 RepID=UPI003316585B